jgi:DNA topoisomerase-1
MSKLLIIESPGKIKKLRSLLGSEWDIKASFGHIRELAHDGDDSLGFDLVGNRINCRFQPKNSNAHKTISSLKTAAKKADKVYLGTDPDREGETISWHLAQVLGLKNPERIVYQEITASAIKKAVDNPRPLDQNLVNAGLARTCLDKLVGYRGSPLLWALNNGAKSMGRVQSATLHLLVTREKEIITFKPTDYWSVWVDYLEGFRAYYFADDKATQSEKDDDAADPNSQNKPESSRVLSEKEADRLVEIARSHPHHLQSITSKTVEKKPPPPFTTSSLQQAAGSRFTFNPDKTMKVAQNLYEKGLITYMRTDSVALSPQFCQQVRTWLQTKDPDNLPNKTTKFRASKNAQEAHEAIRPTDINLPSVQLKQELSNDEFELYLLIWLRAVASQCKPALIEKTVVITISGEIKWKAKGQIVKFKGYAKYWKNLSADCQLPSLKQGQSLNVNNASHEKKQTQPPPRYSEPKLVQLMEKKGIGRPSTYAPTIKTLKERNYVSLKKRQLHPTPLGIEVDDFLIKVLPELLQSEFTAQMEQQLDTIAEGKTEWQSYLTGWNHDYFAPAITKAKTLVGKVKTSTSKTREKSDLPCPQCQQLLTQIPSQSKKLDVPYFLKCENGCDLVMFFNKKINQWLQPGTSPSPEKPQELTQFSCPVCGQFLEKYHYSKNGQDKTMLRCSHPQSRQDKKHKDVAFFWSKNVWWSKKYGELKDK